MSATLVAAILVPLLGFACGALAWGLWIGRAARGIDVREHGSRNLGATNVYRVLGPGLGVATLVLDILKGAAPVWIVRAWPLAPSFPGGGEWAAVTAGLAAVLGHVFTPFAGFRGGKGVATTVGVLLALAPPAFLVFVIVFFVTLAITRFVSLGSTLGAIAFCVALPRFTAGGWRSPVFALGLALALVVIVRHRDNYRRLLRGEERRFAFRRKETEA